MPRGVHKNPFLGWNPPAEDSAWLEDEVQRRGGGRGIRTALLNEALADLRAKHSAGGAQHPAAAVSPPRARKPREAAAPAARFIAAGEPGPQPAQRRHAVNCKCGICRPKKEGQ